MKKIIINNEIKDITPEIVAELFANMRSDEQAMFFNHVAEVAGKWSSGLEFQLQWVTDDDGLSLAGRRVMQAIGDYSHWGVLK